MITLSQKHQEMLWGLKYWATHEGLVAMVFFATSVLPPACGALMIAMRAKPCPVYRYSIGPGMVPPLGEVRR